MIIYDTGALVAAERVLAKLDLPPAGDEHRRVRAVLRYLGA